MRTIDVVLATALSTTALGLASCSKPAPTFKPVVRDATPEELALAQSIRPSKDALFDISKLGPPKTQLIESCPGYETRLPDYDQVTTLCQVRWPTSDTFANYFLKATSTDQQTGIKAYLVLARNDIIEIMTPFALQYSKEQQNGKQVYSLIAKWAPKRDSKVMHLWENSLIGELLVKKSPAQTAYENIEPPIALMLTISNQGTRWIRPEGMEVFASAGPDNRDYLRSRLEMAIDPAAYLRNHNVEIPGDTICWFWTPNGIFSTTPQKTSTK
jgi:hypothetical protein